MTDRNLIVCPLCGFEAWADEEGSNHRCYLPNPFAMIEKIKPHEPVGVIEYTICPDPHKDTHEYFKCTNQKVNETFAVTTAEFSIPHSPHALLDEQAKVIQATFNKIAMGHYEKHLFGVQVMNNVELDIKPNVGILILDKVP